jgi:membrane protein required for colicin V production
MEHSNLLGITWADYAIVSIVVFSVLISLMRGFVREALSLATWIVAFWIALKFNGTLSVFLAAYIATPSLRIFASFGLLFVFSLILGSLFSFLLSRLIISTGLSGTDRSLGLIFGLVRGTLLVGILLLLISFTSFAQDSWYKNSVAIPHFQPLVTWLKGFLPDTMKQISGLVTKAGQL